MSATNKHIGFQSFNGRTSPIIIYLPVQAGSSQVIKKGEICKVRSLTDYTTYPVIPVSADDADFIPVIAWEEQKLGDSARKIAFALPVPGDLFEFDLDAATDLRPGLQLELNGSQSLKDGTSNVVAVAFDVDQYITNAGAAVSRSKAWVQFTSVTASGLNQFPLAGNPASITVLNNIGHAITDPGDGEAIPVTASGQIALTIAESATETNTVAAPAQAGLELLIMAASTGSGGSRAITFAEAIDGTNDVATFDADAEHLRVMSVQTGAATYGWRKVSSVGVSLSAS